MLTYSRYSKLKYFTFQWQCWHPKPSSTLLPRLFLAIRCQHPPEYHPIKNIECLLLIQIGSVLCDWWVVLFACFEEMWILYSGYISISVNHFQFSAKRYLHFHCKLCNKYLWIFFDQKLIPQKFLLLRCLKWGSTSKAAQLEAGCILEVDPPAWRQVVALLPRLKVPILQIEVGTWKPWKNYLGKQPACWSPGLVANSITPPHLLLPNIKFNFN